MISNARSERDNENNYKNIVHMHARNKICIRFGLFVCSFAI